jgi:hypothetical protein
MIFHSLSWCCSFTASLRVSRGFRTGWHKVAVAVVLRTGPRPRAQISEIPRYCGLSSLLVLRDRYHSNRVWCFSDAPPGGNGTAGLLQVGSSWRFTKRKENCLILDSIQTGFVLRNALRSRSGTSIISLRLDLFPMAPPGDGDHMVSCRIPERHKRESATREPASPCGLQAQKSWILDLSGSTLTAVFLPKPQNRPPHKIKLNFSVNHNLERCSTFLLQHSPWADAPSAPHRLPGVSYHPYSKRAS